MNDDTILQGNILELYKNISQSFIPGLSHLFNNLTNPFDIPHKVILPPGMTGHNPEDFLDVNNMKISDDGFIAYPFYQTTGVPNTAFPTFYPSNPIEQDISFMNSDEAVAFGTQMPPIMDISSNYNCCY